MNMLAAIGMVMDVGVCRGLGLRLLMAALVLAAVVIVCRSLLATVFLVPRA